MNGTSHLTISAGLVLTQRTTLGSLIAQETVQIGSEMTCPECVIELEHMVTLGEGVPSVVET